MLPPEEWSCALLAAKSKMMKETLPVCDTDVCRTSFHGEQGSWRSSMRRPL